MKRDMDLIRKIILQIEDHPHGFAPTLEVEGHTREQVGYHAYLIVGSGLANGQSIATTSDMSPCYRIAQLTPRGHDFADAARAPHVWDEVVQDVRSKGLGSASLEIIKGMLDGKIRKLLELPS